MPQQGLSQQNSERLSTDNSAPDKEVVVCALFSFELREKLYTKRAQTKGALTATLAEATSVAMSSAMRADDEDDDSDDAAATHVRAVT